MKRIAIGTAGVLLLGVLSAVTITTNPVIRLNAPASEWSVDPASLKKHVDSLTRITPPRNHDNIASLDLAAEYIATELRRQTDLVEIQEFAVEGRTYRNVSARFGPADGDRIVVGAHYDVCGDQPGADDNASGVAGLLEIASFLNGRELRRPIELVAYTLEEPPNFRTENMGSAHHAKMLHDQKVAVRCMISLECIGYFSDDANSQAYPIGFLQWFYPDKGQFIAIVSNISGWSLVREMKSIMQSASTVPIESINAPSFVRGVDFSDHLNYWKVGFDAVMITDTAFLRNANYHEVSDAAETLDYSRMAEVVKGVALVLTTL